MTPQEIKAKRYELGLTQQQLGEALGLPKASAGRTIRRWEAGGNKTAMAEVALNNYLNKSDNLEVEG